ncbi:sugar phosphate nucleotidyltransferase [Aestuariibacter sp. AA17]|uniref:Sugar phosphate nucleotidyltransferase n=1 Tax=Fluctibacter corallii TaxID=2984329 RepID=A0ABT3A9U0_9ALTE|nr:sugar phosphate nucleotidyltransferase [Aestuariibacter sp. AA17]MCV2885445.1 sugar phosphate nucleotidyltransferase [Aestuariibacter sp. AA17]
MSNQDLPLYVLAGGKGTRLRSVVADVPKPLAPVNDKPFLYFQLRAWIKQGFKEIVILAGYKAEQIIDAVNSELFSKLKEECHIHVISEDKELGTGGAILNAIEHLEEDRDFVAVNADTWIQEEIHEMVKVNAPAMLIASIPDSSRYGRVLLESDRVVEFIEKNTATISPFINAGVYTLNRDVFKGRKKGDAFSLEYDIFPYLAEKSLLSAVVRELTFIDIGIPEDYDKLRKYLESIKLI